MLFWLKNTSVNAVMDSNIPKSMQLNHHLHIHHDALTHVNGPVRSRTKQMKYLMVMLQRGQASLHRTHRRAKNKQISSKANEHLS